MDKGKDHNINPEEYLRYLDGQMTPRERHDFERSLLDDKFEDEAFEGLSQLTTDEISADLAALKNKLADKTKKRDTGNYWKIAASLLLLGLFSFIVYFLIDSGAPVEIAQTKKEAPVAETDEKQKPVETSPDTSEMDTERIVAYQQDLAKTEEPSPEVLRQPSVQEPVPEEASQGLREVTEDVEEELEEFIDMDIEGAEPLDLPDLTMVEENQIEEDPAERKKEIASEKAFAPATAMRKSSSAKKGRRMAGNANMQTITGTIISEEDDEAIPGVNIIVKGTGTGTTSDIEGKYSIDVPKDEDVTLVYSSVGYMPEEIAVANNTTIDVNIEPDITALSEIVVMGYGTQKKQNTIGAVTTIKMNENNESRYDPPSPIGGHEKFKDYVRENIRYPKPGLEAKVRGTVKLKFTVGRNGKISNMEVLKSLGSDFDQEAIRLVNEGPEWEPAMQNDSTVAKDVKVKIRFRPPE